jgi:hypothetical protein
MIFVWLKNMIQNFFCFFKKTSNVVKKKSYKTISPLKKKNTTVKNKETTKKNKLDEIKAKNKKK